MRVLLRAPLLSLSGYGIHSRQIFEWLESIPDVDLSVEVLKWGMTSWLINDDSESGLVGRIMQKSKGIETPYDVSVQVQLPDEWDTSLGKKNIGVSAFVETDRCNPQWIDKCNEMDAIVVPSTFVKNVVKRSGNLETPITVIPEWYNEEIDKVAPKDYLKFNLNPKFNFLMIGTITSRVPDDDRKNIFYGIKWFCEAFEGDKKVGLVLKANFGRGTKIDRKMTKETIENVIREVRPGKFPKITVVHGNMTQEEIARLYKHPKIKCLVSPTKGEGYGLPLIESAASGLPVVATGWSGHNEFLTKGKYLDIDYVLKEIGKNRIDNRIFMEGTRWANVSENDFKRKIKDLKDNYQIHVKNAKNLELSVRQDFNKDSVIQQYNEFFNLFLEKNR